MKTVPQFEDTLSDVALLLQQQRYDEALPILGDLIEKNPPDRETLMYRLLVIRILVLRHGLSLPSSLPGESSPVSAGVIPKAPSTVRMFDFPKLVRSFLWFRRPRQTPDDAYSQSRSEVAELRQEMDQLRLKNNELRAEIDSLSNKLAASEMRVAALQTLQNDTLSENQQLHGANQELQQEIANIKNQLKTSETRRTESARQAQEIVDRDLQLQTELAEWSQQLRDSQQKIEELQTEQRRLVHVQFENVRLEEQITNVRQQLEWSETRLSESARQNQEMAEHYAQLKNEFVELKQELQQSQMEARALEAVQQRLAGLESREAMLRNHRDQLETQVAALQRELFTRQEQIEELDTAHIQLAELERVYKDLREENHRLKEKIAGSAETQMQIGTLRQQRDESQKQALLDSNFPVTEASWRRRSNANLQGALQNPRNRVRSTWQYTKEEIKAVWTSSTRKWRFGMIPATGALVIAGLVALGFLAKSPDESSGSKQIAVAPVTASEPSTPTGTVVTVPERSGPASVITAGSESSKTRRTKPAPRLRGTFKVTHQTQVYSGPSEISLLIGSIGPGMKINVVDSRDGWLEISSKNGRRPGFVRQNAAVRVHEAR